ncbi:MAG: hypothetical protein B7Z37_28470 [Verrucomicrobia bacterium 12-59-8]|nr:MAG: hypothetical protein B7Z37_28470 [Verrucomicrobia bacterium 12-59-8]
MITATIRTEDERWPRLFVTIDGKEWLLPVAKDIILAQGVTLPPEGWTGPTEERYIFTDLRDEDSPADVLDGITDPVLVGLAIRGRNATGDGPVSIPSEAEGLAAIRWMCMQQRERGCHSAARPDSA